MLYFTTTDPDGSISGLASNLFASAEKAADEQERQQAKAQDMGLKNTFYVIGEISVNAAKADENLKKLIR